MVCNKPLELGVRYFLLLKGTKMGSRDKTLFLLKHDSDNLLV
jgi:hypothetical protein